MVALYVQAHPLVNWRTPTNLLRTHWSYWHAPINKGGQPVHMVLSLAINGSSFAVTFTGPVCAVTIIIGNQQENEPALKDSGRK